PIQLFAIRTQKIKPTEKRSSSRLDNRTLDAQELPATVGEYQNPRAIQYEKTYSIGDGKTATDFWNYKWDDIDFPVTMAKPQIMQATSRAMALKIFDQIGVFPETVKDDPV